MPNLPVIPIHDLARHLKARLDALPNAHTDWRIRVTGRWMTVLWTNTPSMEEAAQAVGQLTGFDWNADTQTCLPAGKAIAVPVKGREVTGLPGADGITLTRTFDEYTLLCARRYWSERQRQPIDGATGVFPSVMASWHGIVVAQPGTPKAQVREIADHMVHRGWFL